MNRLIAPLAAFLFIAGLFQSPLRAGEVETVRFGVVLSLTGDFAGLGNTYLEGIRLRLAAHEEKGGSPRLEMVIRDDQSDPEIAAQLTRQLLEIDNVAAIIGSDTTDLTLAIRPVTMELGSVLISPSATADILGRDGDGTFRVLFDNSFQGQAMARFLRDSLRLERAASISNSRYAYSRRIARAFAQAFRDAGGTMVAEESYERAVRDPDGDFHDLLLQVKSERPQAVLLPNYFEEVIQLLQQSLDIELDVVYCGGDAWDQDAVLLQSGNALRNAYYIGIMNEDSGTPEMREFMARLNLSNDDHAEPVSVLGYDALSLLIEGLRLRSGEDTLRDAMYRIRDFPLATGVITIDRERGVQKTAYIIKVGELGNFFTRQVIETIHPD